MTPEQENQLVVATFFDQEAFRRIKEQNAELKAKLEIAIYYLAAVVDSPTLAYARKTASSCLERLK